MSVSQLGEGVSIFIIIMLCPRPRVSSGKGIYKPKLCKHLLVQSKNSSEHVKMGHLLLQAFSFTPRLSQSHALYSHMPDSLSTPASILLLHHALRLGYMRAITYNSTLFVSTSS